MAGIYNTIHAVDEFLGGSQRRHTVEPLELPYTTIGLIHDTKTRCWGIPIGDGRYYYIAQVMLEQVYDLRTIYEYVNQQYGTDIPLAAYEAMRNMRNDTHHIVYINVINPISSYDIFAG